MFCCIYIPQLLHPFICWWTLLSYFLKLTFQEVASGRFNPSFPCLQSQQSLPSLFPGSSCYACYGAPGPSAHPPYLLIFPEVAECQRACIVVIILWRKFQLRNLSDFDGCSMIQLICSFFSFLPDFIFYCVTHFHGSKSKWYKKSFSQMSHFHSYSPFPGPLLTSVIGDHSFQFILPVFLSTKDPEHIDTHTCMNV